MIEIILVLLPKIKDNELSKRLNAGSISNRWSERTGKYSTSSPRAKICDLDFKSLTNKFSEILTKRKKRKLKSKSEIFKFMSKYNELIEEGLRKVCRGRFEISARNNEFNSTSQQDSFDLKSFFSMFSKSSLFLVIDMIDKKEQ